MTSPRQPLVIPGEVVGSHTGPTSSMGQPGTGQPATGQPTYRASAPAYQVGAAPLIPIRRRSVLLAALLGFFLGPIGMLYATIPGALIMGFVTIVATVVTLGHAALFPFPVCAIWAAWAAFRKNQWAQALGWARRW